MLTADLKDHKKELSWEALRFIDQANFNMYVDERKDKVKDVWAARVSQIEEDRKKIPKRPSGNTDAEELRPEYSEFDTFPGTLPDILSMHAEIYLRSSGNGEH